ncbi:hypothetical protein Cadr_000006163 [Camelus dromedarius]|uniref:Uncharacterized protein n=1 Tax=Camelus dromedarius TaxID=9838 RepID=A0A5N4E2L2_CAMDR|nr:hypothetical protein Cadr_000006163 [Camelus dromedarius]
MVVAPAAPGVVAAWGLEGPLLSAGRGGTNPICRPELWPWMHAAGRQRRQVPSYGADREKA